MKENKEYDISKEENKTCWLFQYGCPCKTGSCHIGLPGNDCGTYRWFKELIEYNKEHHPERA